jgi:hypothetical protein
LLIGWHGICSIYGQIKQKGKRQMKQKLYKTAKATISCAKFNAGEFVSVSYYWTDENGIDWYICNESAVYPETQLKEFCL